MTFSGDSYSKAGSIRQGFKFLLPALMHGAEKYDQHYINNSNMRVYPGLDLSV
ncbi:hypothetical protein ACSAZL_03370 [Methanosarcina sp. T3]|uniref:hypothetical protein n=1 Tax=Methanosarcina sp. T3 TaxID=3439062 RepID=UPI003F8773C1